MKKVPFTNLLAGYQELKTEIDESISRVLDSGQYILGTELELFEEEFARYCEAKFVIGMANGLDALHLALRAMDVGPGDEVIVPSNTFIATWLAVSECGATPVPVEPDQITFNLDPERLESAITSKTKAVVPVHLYGQPADLDPIIAIAKKYKLWVLEDAAQAHGARYKGRKIGSHSDAVAWSFYPGKNLGAFGDGGAITTQNSFIADRIKALRNYGSKVKYEHAVKGYNSRLDPIQASVLRVKLKKLDEWNIRRRQIAKNYLEGIKSIDLILPKYLDYCEPVWHLFVVRSPKRNDLQKKLNAAGISTLIHYPIPPHRQRAYNLNFNLPLADQIASEVLSLPIGPHIDHDQVQYVIEIINNI
jgi:dTDP-4-amino-4,6-dideoxygalactose transaminase